MKRSSYEFFKGLFGTILLVLCGIFMAGHTFTVLFIGLALAVKHISYILLMGDIFQPLRTFLSRRQKEGLSESGWRKQWLVKPHVLFSCNLCMTVQVAFWFVVLPGTVLLHMQDPHILETTLGFELSESAEWVYLVLAMFMSVMVIAALAMFLWRILEFPREYMDEQVAAYEKAMADRLKPGVNETQERVDLSVIILLLEKVHYHCEPDSYCIYELQRCARTKWAKILESVLSEKSLTDFQVNFIREKTRDLVQTYLRGMREQYTRPEYVEIRLRLAEEFLASV